MEHMLIINWFCSKTLSLGGGLERLKSHVSSARMGPAGLPSSADVTSLFLPLRIFLCWLWAPGEERDLGKPSLPSPGRGRGGGGGSGLDEAERRNLFDICSLLREQGIDPPSSLSLHICSSLAEEKLPLELTTPVVVSINAEFTRDLLGDQGWILWDFNAGLSDFSITVN